MVAKLPKFTKTEIDKLTPEGAPYFVSTGNRNLLIRVMPTGHRSYVFAYRFPRGRGGKKRSISRDCGEVTVKQIGELAARWNGWLADGIDPREKIEKVASDARDRHNAPTVERIARQFVEQWAKPRNRSWRETERILNRHVIPAWGNRTIASIKRRDVNELIDEIHKNAPVMAERVLMQVRKLFNWHATRDDEFASPIVRGMSRISWSKIARDRVLTDDELRVMWSALDASSPPFRQIMRFLLLTAQRRDEVAKARFAEFDGNVWTIPRERYKTDRPNVVPLTTAALAVRAELPQRKPHHYAFATRGDAPFSGFSKSKARLDAEMLRIMREDDPKAVLKPWRIHDLRRTAKTLMARARVPREYSERVLGHVLDGVEQTYDRHSYFTEKSEALEMLARQIEGILRNSGNVVPLPARRSV